MPPWLKSLHHRDIETQRNRMEQNLILTYLLLVPVIGSVLVLFFKNENKQLIRWYALGISVLAFVLSIFAYIKFNQTNSQFQLIDKFVWVQSLNISYHVGVDGISLILVLLTTFLTPLTFLSTWKAIEKNVKMFTFSMLFLEAGMIGVFISLDIFLFYVFWDGGFRVQ